MPSYTVARAEEKKRLPASGKFPPKVIYTMVLDDGGLHGKECEWKRNEGSPPPFVGQTLEGSITQGKYSLEFSQEGNGSASSYGGGGSASFGDRKKDAEIRCEVAAKAAIWLLQAEVAAGLRFDNAKASELIRPRIEFFEQIFREAGEKAG